MPIDVTRNSNMTTTILDTPLNLPCGATLPNRLAKAAMSEGLADADNQATPGSRRSTGAGRIPAPGCYSAAIFKWTAGIWSGQAMLCSMRRPICPL